MGRDNYEVCIIGAGIAGSTLALNLTPDFDVCLIEKKSKNELGKKPCGNAVHKNWFKPKDVKPHPKDFDSIASISKSIKLHQPNEEHETELPPGRELLLLNREKFTQGAVEKAMDQGCDLFTDRANPEIKNEKVREIKTEDKKIKAKTYVDSSGTASVLRKNFEPTPTNSHFTGYREIIDKELDDKTCHAFQYKSTHGLWVFPTNGKTNIGAALFQKNGTNLKNKVKKLKKKLNLEEKVLRSGHAPIPSQKPLNLVHENTVAIGDAGFTVNPLTGGGIGPSIRAANLLANTLKENKNLEEFQKRYMKKIANGYDRNYYLSRLFLKIPTSLINRMTKWAFKNFYCGTPLQTLLKKIFKKS